MKVSIDARTAKQKTLFSFFHKKKDGSTEEPQEVQRGKVDPSIESPAILQETAIDDSTVQDHVVRVSDPDEKPMAAAVTPPSTSSTKRGHHNTAFQPTNSKETKESRIHSTVSVVPSFDEHLSEYEKLRLRNMKRNHDRLVSLGLIDPSTPCPGQPLSSHSHSNRQDELNSTKKPKRRKKSYSRNIKNVDASVCNLPLRRSTRNRNATRVGTASGVYALSGQRNEIHSDHPKQQKDVAMGNDNDNEIQEIDQFEDSPLVQYSMTMDGNHTQWKSQKSKSFGKLQSFVPRSRFPRLVSPKANHALYSLDVFQTRTSGSGQSHGVCSQNDSIEWIVGAGKSGIVSIWNCSNASDSKENDKVGEGEDGLEPVMSWKGHGGRWVADAIFVPSKIGDLNSSNSSSSSLTSNYTNPSHLLTAANDGKVCLWDVRSLSTKTGAPRNLVTTGSSLHTGGIFSMHTNAEGDNYGDILVCTGSKDKTLKVSSLESISHGGCSSGPMFVSNHHSAKVGCVQMKGHGSALIGSASDDGSVAVHDFRSRTIVADIDFAHDKPHSFVWDAPCDSHNFLTAGYDATIRSWDLRSLKEPLNSYHGHVPVTTTRCKRIHRPCIFRQSMDTCNMTEDKLRYIISGSEKSGGLSIFQASGFEIGNEGQNPCASQHTQIPVYSRGFLPDDCGDAGCIAVHGSNVAVAVDGGDILILDTICE